MATRLYQPSGKSNPGAVGRLLLVALAVGLVTGAVEGVVSNFINLMIIFPALIGLAVGAVVAKQVESCHVRAPGLAAFAACLGALLGQATVHVPAYLSFRSKLIEISAHDRKELIATTEDATRRGELEKMTDDEWADRSLEMDTGSSGILGYLKVAASVGVKIGRVGEGDKKGLTLSGPAAWILWAAEFVLAAWIALAMARTAAREPYCEECRRWYDPATVVAVGSGEKVHWHPVAEALRGGDFPRALGALGSPGPAGVSAISLRSCKQCNFGDSILAFAVITTKNKKEERKECHAALLTRDEAKIFLDHAVKEAEKPS